MSTNILYEFRINRFKYHVSFEHNPILPYFIYNIHNSVQQTIFSHQDVLKTSLA